MRFCGHPAAATVHSPALTLDAKGCVDKQHHGDAVYEAPVAVAASMQKTSQLSILRAGGRRID